MSKVLIIYYLTEKSEALAASDFLVKVMVEFPVNAG